MLEFEQIWSGILTFSRQNADLLGVAVGAAGVLVAIFFGFIQWIGSPRRRLVLDSPGQTRRLHPFKPGDAAKGLIEQPSKLEFSLPPVNPDFVGRLEVVERIKGILRQGSAVVASVEGMGGIGKTTTSVEAVHNLLGEGQFCDGIAFINLEGFNATRPPKTPEEAFTELLRPLVDAKMKLPADRIELQRIWRKKTSGLNMLLFLDNARDEDQVGSLIPGHKTCKVLITSRNAFSIAGIQPVDLTLMDPEESQALALSLANRRHFDRLSQDQSAKLAVACGHLPLAIEVLANTLDRSSGLNVDFVLASVSADGRLPPALERAKISLRASVDSLDKSTRARWQALGVFEGSFDLAAVEAVWAFSEPEYTLNELESYSLVEFDRDRKRYALHDILRTIALEGLNEELDQANNTKWRHADHFCSVLEESNNLCLSGGKGLISGLYLFDENDQNILSGQLWSSSSAEESEKTAQIFARYGKAGHYILLWYRGSQQARITLLNNLLSVSRKIKDKKMESSALGMISATTYRLGNFRRALVSSNEWLVISRELGNRRDEGEALNNAGISYFHLGEPRQALAVLKEAAQILREVGEQRLEGYALGNIGDVLNSIGDYTQAITKYEQHLEISRQLDEPITQSFRLSCLGSVNVSLGNFQYSFECLNKALSIAREYGERHHECRALRELGYWHNMRKKPKQSLEYYEDALSVALEIGDRFGESEALSGLGVGLAVKGNHKEAISFFERQFTLAKDIGNINGQANALFHWAEEAYKLGRGKNAIRMMRESAAILGRLESPLLGRAQDYLNRWEKSLSEQ